MTTEPDDGAPDPDFDPDSPPPLPPHPGGYWMEDIFSHRADPGAAAGGYQGDVLKEEPKDAP